jgi:hypothetical protein
MKNKLSDYWWLRAAALFLVSYGVFVAVWIKAGGCYGLAVASAGGYLVSYVKDVEVVSVKAENGAVTIEFVPARSLPGPESKLTLPTSSYTFNVPVTFAILAALYPSLRKLSRKNAETKKNKTLTVAFLLISAIAILLFIHLFYVFTFYGDKISTGLIEQGYKTHGYETVERQRAFLWHLGFFISESFLIRFEPFIVGFYAYARYMAGK